jgi:hypothetical protein
MKVSFDFDSTLDQERIQRIALKFIEAGHEVWIHTTRLDNTKAPSHRWNDDLLEVSRKLGIFMDKIVWTNGEDKWKFLEDFDLHFDDDQVEIELIEENLEKCVGILVYDI